MMGLCREQYGYLREQHEALPIDQCAQCGRSLYDGEAVYALPNGAVLCYDRRCLDDYIGVELTELREPAGPGEDW